MSEFLNSLWERTLNTHFFFSNFSGAQRDIPAKIAGYPAQEVWFPWASKDIPSFGPHHFTWKTPTPPEDIRPQKFGFVFLFLRSCLINCVFLEKDAAFLLTVGSFLLTVELSYLQLTILASLLTVGAFLLTMLALLLTVGKCV